MAMKRASARLVWLVVGTTVLFTALYYLLPMTGFFYLPIVYLVLGAGLGFFYVIYNRGFVNKNAKREELPASMSEEEKDAFLALGKERFEKSRPVLAILFSLILVFLIDLTVLFLIPALEGLFA